MRKFHWYLLFPVLTFALLLSGLRIGLQDHLAYHDKVESWLSDALAQEVTIDDFSLLLKGTQLHINVKGMDVNTGELSSHRIFFNINLFHWLFNKSAIIEQVYVKDVQIAVKQQADGQWWLRQQKGTASPAFSKMLAQVKTLSGDSSQITLLPYQAAPIVVHGVNFSLQKQGLRRWMVFVNGQHTHQGNNNTQQVQAEITLTDNLAIQSLRGNAQLNQWPLTHLLPASLTNHIHIDQLTGAFSIDHNANKTQLQGNRVSLLGSYQQRLWQWQSDMEITVSGGRWHWQVGNVQGGIAPINRPDDAKNSAHYPLKAVLPWPVEHLQGAYQQGQVTLKGDAVHLQNMVQLVASIKAIPTDISTPIEALNPRGHLNNVRFYWHKAYAQDFLLLGDMEKVGVSDWEGVPSVAGADGQLSLTSTGGKVTLANQDTIRVHLPELTKQPWQFDGMQGQIAWQISTDDIYLDSHHLRIQQGEHQSILLMSGQFPINTTAASATNQTEASAKVQVIFSAQDYPIKQLTNIVPDMVPLPQWLLDFNLQGDVRINVNAKIAPHTESAKHSPEASKVDFVYTVDGKNIHGLHKASAMRLDALSVSLEQKNNLIKRLEMDGLANNQPMRVALVDKIPADHVYKAQSTLLWHVLGNNNHLEPQQWLRIEGSVTRDVGAQLLGADSLPPHWLPSNVQLDAYAPSCIMTFAARCQMAVGTANFAEKPTAWPQVIQHTGGLAWAWSNHVDVHKAAATHTRLLFSNQQQSIHLALQDKQLKGVGVGLFVPAPKVQEGLVVHGRLDSVDADDWMTALQFFANKEGDRRLDDESSQHSVLNSQLMNAASLDIAFPVLQQVEIQINTLHWQERLFNNVDIAYQRHDKNASDTINNATAGWAVVVDSENLAMSLVNAGNETPLLLDVKYLHLMPSNKVANKKTPKPINNSQVDLLQDLDPLLFPDMDITIGELTNDQQHYGHWNAKVRNQEGKIFVHDLTADMGHSQLAGNLIWSKEAQQHKTIFSGTIFSESVAKAFENWGYTATLDSQDGSLDVHLTWPASPVAFAVQHATGDIALRIKKGRLLETSQGLKKSNIITLLDFDKLLSLLTLQLSAITKSKYDFDHIIANYTIQDGVANTTTPAEFFSNNMEISLEGSIDFQQRTLNKDLFLTVPLAEKLPFLALLTSTPQLSGLLYVVEKLIGDELAAFTSLRMSITGDLDNPTTEFEQIFDTNNDTKGLSERANNVFNIQ